MEASIVQISLMVNGIEEFVYGSAQNLEIAEVEKRFLSVVVKIGRARLEEFVAEKRIWQSSNASPQDFSTFFKEMIIS